MDINKIKSNLKMKNFYFCNCVFERQALIKDGEYSVNLEKEISEVAEHAYEVMLTTTVSKEDMSLTVVAKAEFLYDSEDYSREQSLIETNTVAIMFPFVRSQVTLMTSQPGMTPVVLPAINVTKL